MTLTQVWGLLVQLFGLVTTVLGLVQRTAQENTPHAIETSTAITQSLVTDPTVGLTALHADVASARADILSAVALARVDSGPSHPACIQDVLDSLAAGVVVITLPAHPPVDWPDDIAQAVWLQTYQTTGVTFADLLARAGTESWYRAYHAAQEFANAPWFQWDHCNALALGLGNPGGNLWPPMPDYSRVAEFDSVLEWLNTTDQQYTGLWLLDTDTSLAYTDVDVSSSPHIYTTVHCVITPADWAVIRNAVAPVNAGAPVWPGLANVTLGTPVALTADLTVTGPLDGLILEVTTPPSGLGSFSVGGHRWWFRAGHVAFVDDNGDVEGWQYVTWDNALYCPRTMRRAASALVRGLGGIGGTVTPWLTT